MLLRTIALFFLLSGNMLAFASESKGSADDSSQTVYWVQAASFLVQEKAESYTNILKDVGYKPYILLIYDKNHRSWYTVNIGKFFHRKAAQKEANTFKARSKQKVIVYSASLDKYTQFLGRMSHNDLARQPVNPEERPASASNTSTGTIEEQKQEAVVSSEPESMADESSTKTQKTGWFAPGQQVKYIVAGVGFSKLNLKNTEFDHAIGDQFSTTSSVDSTNVGWKLVGGYRWNSYFGVEAGYVDLGEVKYEVTSNTPESVLVPAVQAVAPLSLSGAVLEGVGYWPVTSRCSLLGKGGGFFWNGRSDVTTGAGQQVTRKDSGTDLTLGLGGQCQISEKSALRLELERFFVGDRVDFVTAGMGVMF